MNAFNVPCENYLMLNKKMLIIPLMAAMIFAIFFEPLEIAYSENATKSDDVCLSCGVVGINITNSSMNGNATNDTLSNPLLDKKSG
jgi:hypothetical protein